MVIKSLLKLYFKISNCTHNLYFLNFGPPHPGYNYYYYPINIYQFEIVDISTDNNFIYYCVEI